MMPFTDPNGPAHRPSRAPHPGAHLREGYRDRVARLDGSEHQAEVHPAYWAAWVAAVRCHFARSHRGSLSLLLAAPFSPGLIGFDELLRHLLRDTCFFGKIGIMGSRFHKAMLLG
jgi:hypothetical protein